MCILVVSIVQETYSMKKKTFKEYFKFYKQQLTSIDAIVKRHETTPLSLWGISAMAPSVVYYQMRQGELAQGLDDRINVTIEQVLSSDSVDILFDVPPLSCEQNAWKKMDWVDDLLTELLNKSNRSPQLS